MPSPVRRWDWPADVEAGYEPARVHELARRTAEAIDLLGHVRSEDPAAAEAIRTVRLTRSNLEDHWMPALRDIERSDAMVRWRSNRLGSAGLRPLSTLVRSRAGQLVSGTPTVGAMSAERRDALIAELDWLERRALSGVDGSGAPSDDELAALGRRLAAWIRRDDTFADQLVELSVSNMLIARLLGHARFPSSFAAAVVRRMAAPNGPDTGVDHDRYAASLSIALSSLADDPTACLDLLLDEPTAHALASWQALDTAMLADFVVSGLHGAIAVDPARLDDGYGVLRFLTRAANGPLDGGMSAGMAVGVASSLAGYIDTLAPGIRQEGSTPVTVRAVDPPLELGSYDDLVDLFGSLLRVPEAQAALGTVLAAYTFETFERIGGDAARRPDPTYVAQFADLIGDASRTEQVELVMAAAAEEARRRRLGGLVGFGVNATLLVAGAGSVARSVAGQAVRMATSWAARVEPERLADSQIPAHTHDLITVAALAVVATDPSARRAAGLGAVTAAQWSHARRRLRTIEQTVDPRERMTAVGDLDHWIETSVPALAAYLLSIRSMPGMHELTEGRNAVGAD
jgi:hypothetical protein